MNSTTGKNFNIDPYCKKESTFDVQKNMYDVAKSKQLLQLGSMGKLLHLLSHPVENSFQTSSKHEVIEVSVSLIG